MFIEFILQGHENYGTPERPHWKDKSGDTYLLPVDAEALQTAPNKEEFLEDLAQRATRVLNQRSPMWDQYVIDWQLVDADHYTDFELDQLEYDGYITYWAEIVELPPVSAAA